MLDQNKKYEREIELIPIQDRVNQINSNILIKTLLAEESFLSEEIRKNIKSKMLEIPLRTLKSSGIDKNSIEIDIDHLNLPPWEELPFIIKVDKQEANKKHTAQNKLREIYTKQILELDEKMDYISYTDGSVLKESKSQRSGAATIIKRNKSDNNPEIIKIRTSDGVSSLQTEVAAIAATLVKLKSLDDWSQAVVHTDSLSSIQALAIRHNQENKSITSTCKKLALNLIRINKDVTLHYIPSHVGILGNEEADHIAKKATQKPNIDIKINLSKTVLKSRIKKYTLDKLYNKENDDKSESLSWRNKIKNNTNICKLKNREMEVKLYRIILGYKSYKQLKNEQEVCKFCNDMYLSPLEHWTECSIVLHELEDIINKEAYNKLKCSDKINLLITKHYNKFMELIHDYPVPR